MKKILRLSAFAWIVACAMISVSSIAHAGVRVSLEVNVTSAQPLENDGSGKTILRFAQLDDGSIIENSTTLFRLGKTGHYRLGLQSVRPTDSSVSALLSIWDRAGLPPNSPRYRSFTTSQHRLSAGEAQTVTVTQGDASAITPNFYRYTIEMQLLAIEACDDATTCREP